MTLTDLLDMLSGVKQVGTGYMALCPSHPDEKASLHVTSNGKGLALKCHAGCDTSDILDSLDLEWDDLFFAEKEANGTRKEIINTYDYTDEKGQLLYQVVRYHPKEFRQRRPDGNGGWTWSVKNTRKVPYMLHELIEFPDSPIFIVEGEKDVHALRPHGYIATTNAGGAGKWQEDWTPIFKGRRVYLIPDNDEPGVQHMNKVGLTLSTVADVRIVTLVGAKDTAEFLQLHKDIKKFEEAVELAVPFAEQEEEQEEGDQDIVFPPAPIYEGLLGQFIKLIEPHTEADPIAIFMELLVAAGNHLNTGPHFLIEATKHHANLFIAICGVTAVGRKGTAHDWMESIFEKFNDGYVDNCLYSGLASGEGLIHAVRDPITKPDKKDPEKQVVIDDGVTDKRKLFFESELAGRTFTAMAREGSTLSSVLRQAWDGKNLNVATKQNSERATKPHISVIGHTTFRELVSVMRTQDIDGGTANRFLYFRVNRSKRLPRPTYPDQLKLDRLTNTLRNALAEGRKLNLVELSPAAEEQWDKLYNQVDDELLGEETAYVPFLSRALPQIKRMAMILSIIEGHRQITPEALQQATGLYEYSRASVSYMFGMTNVHLTPDEERLYTHLEKYGPAQPKDLKNELKWSGKKVAYVAAQLLKKRMIREEKIPDTGGRPGRKLSV